MHTQLMRFAGFRVQHVIHICLAVDATYRAPPLNQRLRIDGFRNFVRLKSPAILANMRCSDCRKGLMPVDSYDCSILRMPIGGKRRQTFIGFDGFAILEQHLVSAAQFRFAHKYDDACGKSVQTVRGNNIRYCSRSRINAVSRYHMPRGVVARKCGLSTTIIASFS